jgi:phospho-N-acetylmuramoyl-pentapeptide-transferase
LLAAGGVALLIGLVGTALLIRALRAAGVVQPIHEAVTQHAAKAGTPTMGGLILSVAAPLGYAAALIAIGRRPSSAGVTLVAAILAGGVVGAMDDWLKVRRGRNTLGLRERQKTLLLFVVAAGFVLFAFESGRSCFAPSLARCEPLPDIGRPLWALWVLVVIWMTTNSVNFTDGLDGLLAGSAVPPLALLTVVAYWQFRHPGLYGTTGALDVAFVMIAMTAACCGLLWWTGAPAQVHMGDTGSFAIGMALAVASLTLEIELLVPIFGALFVAEGLSSFAQRMWFRFTRRYFKDHTPRRLFRMAPIHHHFELVWAESAVVVRFWILSGAGAALAGAIFYTDAVAHLPP